MPEIKKGDKVKIKSGTQKMTVQALGDYSSSPEGIVDGVLCVWEDRKGETRSKVFDLAVLEHVDERSAFLFKVF